MRNAYKILVGKIEEKRPLGRPRRRWKYTSNIRMSLREIGWMHLAQDRDQWCALENNETSVLIRSGEFD
jgi:hypothetical protein